MSSAYSYRFKLLVWLLCVSQGLVYIVTTPLWEGWDEAFHYSYVQEFAENRTLPVYGRSVLSKEIAASFDYAPVSYGANLNLDRKYTTFEEYWKLPPDERRRRESQLRSIPNDDRRILPDPSARFANYEAHQAPLYYVLASLVYDLFGSQDLLTRAFGLRVFSLFLGSLIVPIAFAIIRYAGFEPHMKVLPLLLVLLPLLYPSIARIANDSLAVPLFSLLVLLVLRYFAGSNGGRNAVLIGVVLGLGLLTKAYFLTALPALGAIFLMSMFTQRPRKRLLTHACIIALLAVVVAGAWYVRNYALYDNLSGMQEVTRTANLSFADRLRGVTQVEWGSSLRAMLRQHIWIGNTSLLALSVTTYQIGYVLIALAILGSVRGAIAWLALPAADKQSGSHPVTGILAAFYGFFVVGVLYHMLANYMLLGVPDGTGGWYLYAVIIPELILLVRGLESLVGPRFASAGSWILVAYVLVANLVSLLCKVLPAYGGFIIPRFHLTHFLELYSPTGLRVMLGNLAINKPEFVTPAVIGLLLAISLVVLGATLREAWLRRP